MKFLKLILSSLAIGSALQASSAAAPSASPSKDPTNYLGIGSSIGLNGNTTSLGTGGGLAILSKVRFTENLSLHDATILFGSGAAEMVACFSLNTISYDPADGPAWEGHAGLLEGFQQIGTFFTEIELAADFTTINSNEAAPKDIILLYNGGIR